MVLLRYQKSNKFVIMSKNDPRFNSNFNAHAGNENNDRDINNNNNNEELT